MMRFIVGLGIGLLMGACTSQPVRPYTISDEQYLAPDQTAYLWTTGSRHQGTHKGETVSLTDYATVTGIDNITVPDDYTFKTLMEPYAAYLLAIPAGRHHVEIIYKKNTDLCKFSPPFVLGCTSLLKATQFVTFVAEPNRTYLPFAEEYCSRNWFWIEDWGPYQPGLPTLSQVRDSDLSKPLVAGEPPNRASCMDDSEKFTREAM